MDQWFHVLFCFILGTLWIIQSLSCVFTNEIPIAINQTDHPTGVIFATDLLFFVSTLIVGTILLWKKEIWGYMIRNDLLRRYNAKQKDRFYLTGCMLLHASVLMNNGNDMDIISKMVHAESLEQGNLFQIFEEQLGLYSQE